MPGGGKSRSTLIQKKGKGVSLEEFLSTLRAASSPPEKLRLLARNWRSVRRLSTEERGRLARELALEGAEGIVEGLADRYRGISPSMLIDVANRYGAEDMDRWRTRLRLLKSAETRGKALSESLQEIDGLIRAVESRGPVSLAETKPSPATPSPTPVARPTEPAQVRPRPAQRANVSPLPPAPPEPIVVASQPESPPPKIASWARWEARPARTDRRTRESVPVPPEVQTLIEALCSTPSRVRRHRRLDDELDRLPVLDRRSVEALLECFPEGWSRRRALCTLLARRQPASLTESLELVESLSSGAAQWWSLGALLSARELGAREWKLVMAKLTSPTLRRRLALRSRGAATAANGREAGSR